MGTRYYQAIPRKFRVRAEVACVLLIIGCIVYDLITFVFS